MTTSGAEPKPQHFKPPTIAERTSISARGRYVLARLGEGHSAKRIGAALGLGASRIHAMRHDLDRQSRRIAEALPALNHCFAANRLGDLAAAAVFLDNVRVTNALNNSDITTLNALVDVLNDRKGFDLRYSPNLGRVGMAFIIARLAEIGIAPDTSGFWSLPDCRSKPLPTPHYYAPANDRVPPPYRPRSAPLSQPAQLAAPAASPVRRGLIKTMASLFGH